MRVVVASENTVKIKAAEAAFALKLGKQKITYVITSASSDVSDQPMSREETILGACNRAKNASIPNAKFSVGIEGGLCFVKVNGEEHAYQQTWACVLDCETGAYEIASGAAYPVPPNVVRQIKQGKNLTEAMGHEYGTVDLGKNNGYAGWLSDNNLDRLHESKVAVFLALCGLMKEEYQDGKNR